jgi:hypothetical protein
MEKLIIVQTTIDPIPVAARAFAPRWPTIITSTKLIIVLLILLRITGVASFLTSDEMLLSLCIWSVRS